MVGSHPYLEGVECPCCSATKVEQGHECDLCHQLVNMTEIPIHNVDPAITFKLRYAFDQTNHHHLGQLDGMPIDQLITPDHFQPRNDQPLSYDLANWMIIDPLSHIHMRIDTPEEFIASVHQKYPFLKDLNMENALSVEDSFVRFS